MPSRRMRCPAVGEFRARECGGATPCSVRVSGSQKESGGVPRRLIEPGISPIRAGESRLPTDTKFAEEDTRTQDLRWPPSTTWRGICRCNGHNLCGCLFGLESLREVHIETAGHAAPLDPRTHEGTTVRASAGRDFKPTPQEELRYENACTPETGTSGLILPAP